MTDTIYYMYNPFKKVAIVCDNNHSNMRNTNKLMKDFINDAYIVLRFKANEQDQLDFEGYRIQIFVYKTLKGLLDNEFHDNAKRKALIEQAFAPLLSQNYSLAM